MLSKLVLRSHFIRPVNVLSYRGLRTTTYQLNQQDQGSLFSSMTSGVDIFNDNDPTKISNKLAAVSDLMDNDGNSEILDTKDNVTFSNDKLLEEYITKIQEPIKSAPEILLSDLKRSIYEANCLKNGGFYKKDTIVTLPGDNKKYRLKLSRKEIDVLEPSVYVKSYRIKSSMKKATQLLRLLNGLDVKKGLTQCHFSDKKVAREVAELLERGIKDGEKLGLKANDLYISQIWTGSDGSWQKRIDFKGRGRRGIISHPYIHVRCILKTKSVTKMRLAYEATLKQQKQKPWIQLKDKPVRGTMSGVYKW